MVREWSAGLGVLAFSPDGKSLLVGSDSPQKAAWIWDISSGRELQHFQQDTEVTGVAFSRDGTKVATGNRDYLVRVWDVASGKLERSLEGHTNIVWNVRFSPDGKYVVSGSQDRTARLWSLATGKEVRRFPGHDNNAAMYLDYSPDGKRVAVASSDGTVEFSDVDLEVLVGSVCSRVLRDFTGEERTVYSVGDSTPTCERR